MPSRRRRRPSMDENVRKELETLRGMLHNWKRSFLGWASPEGDNEYVLLEFTEEIQLHLYPYVRRLNASHHLSDSEAREFLDYCYGQVDDLRDQLRKVETKQGK
jgi:hypothetical protein